MCLFTRYGGGGSEILSSIYMVSIFQKKENIAIHRVPYLKLSNTQELQKI